MNYDHIANQVLQTIKEYGQSIKVVNIVGTSISTYGVWGKIESEEVSNTETGNITIQTYTIYIPYIKTNPEVGGKIIVNKIQYLITNVEIYQPSTKAVGYKVKMVII